MQKLITHLRIYFSLFLLLITLFGCVAPEEPADPISPVQEENTTNKVALLIPTTSEDPGIDQLAQDLENSTLLALARIQPSPIELTIYDTQGTPQGAFQAASRAIGEGNSIILGPLFSEWCNTSLPRAR